MMHPPRLALLFENPIVNAFVGPGRLTIHHQREVEAAGFRLARSFGGFPAFTLDFEKPLTL